MFGYIRPMECELKVREQALYRAYYCGLCKTIGERYGQTARAVLNYDCTFLALVLSAFSEAPQCVSGGCVPKPWKQKRPIAPHQPALEYAADVNVLLSYYRQADNWNDERRYAALGAKLLLRRAARRAAQRRPALSSAIARRLDALSGLERANTKETDLPAGAFADLMRDIIRFAPDIPERCQLPAEWMFYNLGRWIYLMDAWEDRKRDAAHGCYNPFLAANTSPEDASFLLHVSLTEAEKAYDLLSLQSHVGLLDNIMHLGCRARTRLAMEESLHESL